MQKITIYALANSTLGSIRDYANAKSSSVPVFTRAFPMTIQLRLFATADDETAYPISSFSNITSWQCVWDKDYSQNTTPVIIADNASIVASTVTESIADIERTFTQITIPVSAMNTQQIVDWIGSDESKGGLVMELIGFNGSSEEEFGLQLKGFSMRNRVYYGGTPTVIDPEYLTASQVRALIASGVVLQYSMNGTDWHNAQAIGDNYIRFRSASDASSAWSSAIALPQGVAGEDGEDGEDGADGANAYVYIRYASDTSGSGFSPSPSNSLPYIGVISTNSEIANPTASDFVGKWVRYLGQQGASGQSAYTYVAYASSSSGANFSLTPTSGLKYRAEIHTTTEIVTPTASDFTSATWVKYIGDDGQGAGDMLKAVYDINNDGVVDSATKLATARSIGSASFDGSADISLAQIGAQPALPSGTAGLYLKKTANGVEWDSPTASGGATWGSITGTLQDQSDLNTALSSKISAPASGSTGQFLQKTASGVQWANGSATTDYDTVRIANDDSDIEDIVDYCRENVKPCLFAVTEEKNISATVQNILWKFGHIYMAIPINLKGFFEWHRTGWVETERRYYYRFTGGSCVYDGVTYTLYANGDNEGYHTTDNPYWALQHKYLYISSSERVYAYTTDGTSWVAWHETRTEPDHMWVADTICSSFSPTYQKILVTSYGHSTSTPQTEEEYILVFLADVTRGVFPEEPEVLSGTTATVKPGRLYKYTLTGNSTLSADGGWDSAYASSEIDIVMGAHTLTAGSGMTFATQPTAEKTNHCIVKWRGTSARLTVLDVED